MTHAPFDSTALHAWCLDGDEDGFERLKERWGSDLDVNALDGQGQTPAMIALLNHERPEECWGLLNHDDDLDWSIARPDGQRLVHLVAAHGTVDQMRRLTDEALSLEPVDGQGRTPMHLAALHGQAQIVEVLRTFGALADPVDRQGLTPRDLAQPLGRSWVVRALERPMPPDTILAHVVGRIGPYPDEVIAQVERALAAGADPNVSLDVLTVRWGLEPGARALHAAVLRQSLDVVQRLLAAGAAVDARTEDQATPLMLGALGGPGMVRALLDAGANPMAQAPGRLSPWAAAEEMARLRRDQPGLQAVATLLSEARSRWEQAALRTVLGPEDSRTDVGGPRRRL